MSIELQKMLFQEHPTRRALFSYVSTHPKDYHVQVFRNHSFELVEHTIEAYLDYADLGIDFTYSGYDDSLSFLELDSTADLILLWIDTTRYEHDDVIEFLNGRMIQLRQRCTVPILLIPFGKEIPPIREDIVVYDLTAINDKLGVDFTDERAKAVTGTSLSSRAMLEISRELGLRYLPSLLRPPLKAVVVDLDNTLYQGVLGEDGEQGVILTAGHKLLQERLHKLAAEGVFLCAVSKNNADDVNELLKQRKDFPLLKTDFTKICASWDPKAVSIRNIAKYLNINVDSMVFVDDNIGELTAVQAVFPDIKLIHASDNAAQTAEILSYFPGMLRLKISHEDGIRKDDVKANERRQTLKHTLAPEEYLQSLQLHLTYDYGNPEQIQRIAELSNKTNQFIFNYKRYSQAEVESRMSSDLYCIVTISLSDRLSDSGLIGVCVGRKLLDAVEIEECFISCRALGRGIDDVIVLGAIQGICDEFKSAKVKVLFKDGPRNEPAHRFVYERLAEYLEGPGNFSYCFPKNLLTIKIIKKEG